jgi:hypothetical protein
MSDWLIMINVISFMHFQDENKFINIYELYRNNTVMDQPRRWRLSSTERYGELGMYKKVFVAATMC